MPSLIASMQTPLPIAPIYALLFPGCAAKLFDFAGEKANYFGPNFAWDPPDRRKDETQTLSHF